MYSGQWFAAALPRALLPAYSGRYFISNPLCHRLRRLSLLRLHPDADQRLGAGGTNQDATGVAEYLLDRIFFGLHAWISLPVEAGRNLHIDQYLRIHTDVCCHLGQALSRAFERRHDLQRRNNAVAGGVLVETQQMAGAFTAEQPTTLLQSFQHVA